MPEPYRKPTEAAQRESHHSGFIIRRFQAKKGARITFRIYTPCGLFLDGGNRLLKHAQERINFLTTKGVWIAMRYELRMLNDFKRLEPGALVELKTFNGDKEISSQEIEIEQADVFVDRLAFRGKIVAGQNAGKHKGVNIHKDYFKMVA